MDISIFERESTVIDKNSPIPYHYQLTEIIRGIIKNGTWKAGEKLPSEREFCEFFGISRITVRQALDALISDGIIYRQKGVGTFLSEPKYVEKWSGFPIGYTDSLKAQGIKIVTQVLNIEIILPNEKILKELRVATDTEVIMLHRLRFILDEPILVVHSYLPNHLVPDLGSVDFTKHSLYQTLRSQYGLELAKVKRSIAAVPVTDSEAKLLQIEKGSPLLQVESTSFLPYGQPIEYFIAKRRGDRSRLDFELTKQEV